MNVGVYFDLRNPAKWAQDPTRLYGFTLEMCEEAEHLGAHSVWVTEHHLFDDGYMTQPIGFLAAVAARTKRVRLGTGIVIAPLHHPVELAEQAAMVDIISGGRLDIGLGAGYRVPEFELFGADITKRYTNTDGCARELARIWSEGKVTPMPVQNPVPIWMGYQGPKGAQRAGKMGLGLLCAAGNLWEPYRAGLVEGGHDPASGRMTGGIQGWVSHDPDGDWPQVSEHLAYQVDSYRKHMVEGTDQPTPRAVDPERLRSKGAGGGPLSGFVLGTPAQVADAIRSDAGDAPVETVYFFASLGGMSEEMTARHVQTICNDLRPLLA
jgi:alkanesulfonate monooxygenase SsuD/methylene tetrahydromethanopterin reductase-like flavin-dependent oxidoreductase (luciferase family)